MIQIKESQIKNIVEQVLNESSEPDAIYVGTYGKYNDGSLKGEWVDLSQFDDKQDFYDHISELHSDEDDPEFMFQDIEDNSGFLRNMSSESSIDDAYFELMDEISDWDNDRKEAFAAYRNHVGEEASVSNFEDAYIAEGDGSDGFIANYFEDEMGVAPDPYHSYVTDTDRRLIAGEEQSRFEEDTRHEIERGDYSRLDGVDEDSTQEEIDDAIENKGEEIYNEWYEGLNDPIYFLINDQGIYSDASEISFLRTDYEAWSNDLLSSDVYEASGYYFWNN